MTESALRTARPSPLGATTPAAQALRSLTPRELEVLAMVAAGQTSRAIAGALGITVPTVKSHLRHTYRKLGTANRVQASNIYHLGHPQGNLQGAPLV